MTNPKYINTHTLPSIKKRARRLARKLSRLDGRKCPEYLAVDRAVREMLERLKRGGPNETR